MSVIKLKKPYRHKGEDRYELNLDLDGLTGADIIKVETDLVSQGKIVVTGDYSKLYLSRVAARAAKLPPEVLDQLCAPDFTKVTNEVQAFLLASGSSDESEEQPEEAASTEVPPESFAESQ